MVIIDIFPHIIQLRQLILSKPVLLVLEWTNVLVKPQEQECPRTHKTEGPRALQPTNPHHMIHPSPDKVLGQLPVGSKKKGQV